MKKIKKALSLEQKYIKLKKHFIILLASFTVFVLLTAFYLYLNYDYLVFKHLMAQNYIYTETLDEIYSKNIKIENTQSYYKYFDNAVIDVMLDYIREINNDKYTYLYLPEQYKNHKIQDKQEARMSETKSLSDKTVYIKLTNFSKYTYNFLEKNKSYLSEYNNIIIDLINNPGGDIEVLNKMASMFLEKGSTVMTESTRVKLFTKTTKVNSNKYFDFDKIVILQNKNSASSSEGFIAALKENLDNVTLIGETTFGKGIGQITIPLREGFAVKATVLNWKTPMGNTIHHKGIIPDITYTENDIIEFALSYIE